MTIIKNSNRNSEEDRSWNLSEEILRDLPIPFREDAAKAGPKIIAQIPNYGRFTTESEKKQRKKSFRRVKSIAFWMSGVLIGIAVSKSPVFLKNLDFRFMKTSESSVAEGEYSVSEIPPSESETSTINASFAHSSVTEAIESPEIAAETEWSEESLDSIPLWQPEKETNLFVAQEPTLSVKPDIPSPKTPDLLKEKTSEEKNSFSDIPPMTAAYPDAVPHFEETGVSPSDAYGFMNSGHDIPRPADERGDQKIIPEDVPVSLSEDPPVAEYANATERPMKNEIEIFKPDEEMGESPEPSEEVTRLAASNDFYNDAYGLGSFSDYSLSKEGGENSPQTSKFTGTSGEW